MAETQVVQPQLRSTPTEPGSPVAPMPDDVLADAVRRLRLACAVWIALLATAVAVNHLIVPSLHLPSGQVVPWPPVADALAAACILISALVYWYAARAVGRASMLVNLGIAYEVVLALAIGVINQWEPHVLAGRLSWICALILLYPTIVPASPRKVLIGSRLAASMDPVGLVVAQLRGVELPALGTLVWAYLPNYICAGLAVIPAYVLARLSRQVSRAREMGSYRLGDLIGEGGMGQVWHAHHRMLARPAAIVVFSNPGTTRVEVPQGREGKRALQRKGPTPPKQLRYARNAAAALAATAFQIAPREGASDVRLVPSWRPSAMIPPGPGHRAVGWAAETSPISCAWCPARACHQKLPE